MNATIEQRIGRLERENRIFRVLLGTLTAGLLGFLTLGQVAAPPGRELTAEKLTFVDSAGHVRMVLGPRQTNFGQTFGVNLFDSQGNAVAGLTYASDTKTAVVGVLAENRTAYFKAEPSRISMQVGTPTGTCTIGDVIDGPGFLIQRKVTKFPETELARMDEKGRSEQAVRDLRRSMALFAGLLNGKPCITLSNSDGETVWNAP